MKRFPSSLLSVLLVTATTSGVAAAEIPADLDRPVPDLASMGDFQNLDAVELAQLAISDPRCLGGEETAAKDDEKKPEKKESELSKAAASVLRLGVVVGFIVFLIWLF